ncbi:MAG: xanthine dehydrogenase accessory factor, partial [Kiritimatiellia bacterium]
MWNWVAALHDVRRSPHVLATVIRVKGSAPREVGARLIVDSEGRRHGTLGGGNLEALVEQHARELLGDRTTVCREYALGASAGQCCGG